MNWIKLNRGKIKVFGKKGKVLPKGMAEEHTSFLHSQLSNDIINLKNGQFNYNLWLTGKGEPKEEFYVYKKDDYYILDSSADAEKIIEQFNKIKLSLQVYFEDITDELNHLFIFGEDADRFLKDKFDVAVEKFHFIEKDGVIFANNPYRVGEKGFDIYGDIEKVIKELNKEDEIDEIQFDDIRIKNCIPKIHKELREGFHPLEANILDIAFSLTKGCYVGQEAIARVHFRGKTPRTLAKFSINGDVNENDKILSDEKSIGIITSVNFKKDTALGYILKAKLEEGKEFTAGNGKVKPENICEPKV